MGKQEILDYTQNRSFHGSGSTRECWKRRGMRRCL